MKADASHALEEMLHTFFDTHAHAVPILRIVQGARAQLVACLLMDLRIICNNEQKDIDRV